MDFVAVVEEIALEGLDGITIEALWKRLQDRPGFVDEALDIDTKRYIWKLVTSHPQLQFFVLPEPRPELVIFKYNEYVSKGAIKCTLPPKIPQDIYSRKIVTGCDTFGSCDHFSTRKDISSHVKRDKISLEDAMTSYPQTLVIVANQHLRNLTLLQNCEVTMAAEQYAFLELIGRARYDGEVTFFRAERGLCNPMCKEFSLPANTFSRVIYLDRLGLITKQAFTITYTEPYWVNQVRIVHLKRFYTATNASLRGAIRLLSTHLVKMPSKTAPFYNVLREMDITPEMFQKVCKANKSKGYFFSIRNILRKAYFGNDTAADEKSKESERVLVGTVTEKKVKTITLIKNFDEVDKLDEDETDNAIDEVGMGSIDSKSDVQGIDTNLKKSFPSVDCSVLNQIMAIVEESGEEGVIPTRVMRMLNLSKVNMKYIERELLKTKAIGCISRSYRTMRVQVWVTPEIAERNMTKREDEKKEVTERAEKASTSVASNTLPKKGSEWHYSPEEEEEINERLKDLPLVCEIDRVEAKSTANTDDQRKADRKMLILNNLAHKKVYSSTNEVFHDILAVEREQGKKERVCRKSVKRVIQSLHKEGLIQYLNVSLEDKAQQSRQMITLPGTGADNICVKKAIATFFRPKIQQQIPKSPTKSTEEEQCDEVKGQEEFFHIQCRIDDLGLVSVYKKLSEGVPITEKLPGTKASVSRSKMQRLVSLHTYLVYLLYDYQGSKESVKEDNIEGIDEPVPVHLDVDDWRRYLPPLCLHNDLALKKVAALPGSCMVGDVLMNMPMQKVWLLLNRGVQSGSIVAKFLNDTQLCKVPLCRLPKDVMTEFLFRRRIIARIQEELVCLCYMGLISFGPRQNCNNIEFHSLYLHREGMILDTRASLPCYAMTQCPPGETFPSLSYKVDTSNGAAEYWTDLEIICLGSNLGNRSCVSSDVSGNHGNVLITEASRSKSFAEIGQINQSEWLPGDRRGAGGLDSFLMAHFSKNWWGSYPRIGVSSRLKKVLPPPGRQPPQSGTKKAEKSEEKKTAPHNDDKGCKKRKLAEKKTTQKAERAIPSKFRRIGLYKKRFAKNLPQKVKPKAKARKKRVHESLDATDFQARLGMNRIRSIFTPSENGMLLLSQLACRIIHPRKMCVKGSDIRDLLHEILPQMRNKTSFAVKGKLLRLNADPNFILHLATFMAQAMSDKALMAKLGTNLPPAHSLKMLDLYRMLFMELRKKFSSPMQLSQTLPSSMTDLHEKFTVVHTLKLLYEDLKLDKPVENVGDIRIMVASEFIEAFLHMKHRVSPRSMYAALCKFNSNHLEEARNKLKAFNIIVQLKKYEQRKNRGNQILTSSTALLNNQKSKQIHGNTLKSIMPVDIVSKLNQVFQLLEKSRKSLPQAACTAPPQTHKEIIDDGFIDIDVAEQQGGLSLTAISLTALDMVRHSIVIPEELVGLDSGGCRKLGIAQRGDAAQRKRKRRLFKSKDDQINEEEDDMQDKTFQQTSPTKRRLLRHKFQKEKEIMLASASSQNISGDTETPQVQEIDSSTSDVSGENSSVGGSHTKLPDSQSEPGSNIVPCTTTNASASALFDSSSEPMPSTSSSIPQCTPTSSSQLPASESSSVESVSDSNVLSQYFDPVSTLNHIFCNGVHLSFNPKQPLDEQSKGDTDEISGVSLLPKYLAGIASSCLMTLARTSYIHHVNLLTTDCALNRHFALVPIKIRYRLNDPSYSDKLSRFSGKGKSSKKTGKESLSRPSIEEHVTKQALCSSGSASNSGSVKNPQEQSSSSYLDSHSASDTRSIVEPDVYKAIISQLERTFKPEELTMHVHEAELVDLLPPNLREEGLRFYNLVTEAGKLGCDEREVQVSLLYVVFQENKIPGYKIITNR